jgi:flagellar protein FliS
MLVEGAIRFGRQAEDALRQGDAVAAAAPLLRTLDILGELVAGARETKGELNKKIADLYLYLFRRISEAKINADGATLAEVLRLLEYERQTWQLVCDKLGGGNASSPPPPRSTAFGSSRGQSTKAGISFEA